jgi:hypothetical protein
MVKQDQIPRRLLMISMIVGASEKTKIEAGRLTSCS